jgi:hypothetical protein
MNLPFKNSIITLKSTYLIGFLFAILAVGYFSKNLYQMKTEEYKNNIYTQVDDSILKQFDAILNTKLNTSLLVTSSLSKYAGIKNALLEKDSEKINMTKLLQEMRTNSEYVDIQAEIIDAKGINFKRSWTDASGDDMVKSNPKMEHLLKYPKVYTDIEATGYGMTFTNKIPIYQESVFLGLFGVNIHFDALVDFFAKDGYNTVILLNKNDSKNIRQDLSYSKKFIGDHYVVNSNADDYLIRYIKQNQSDDKWNNDDTEFEVSLQSEHLISKYNIKDINNKVIAKAFIFKSLDEIPLQDLSFMQKAHILATIFLMLLIAFVIKYFYTIAAMKVIQLENEQLVIVNEKLKIKTDEMDFNDKKLDNLFNIQPNLMFIHNGKEITAVNKRFMGFFNRFGTFDGFKSKHKCVSELFEKYEAPNYIWEQNVQGFFWLDYLLQNPKKFYKVVMSINGDPHHFIVKFNEMAYSKHITERIIIVALVDMTQDLANYKSLAQSQEPTSNTLAVATEEIEEEQKEKEKKEEKKAIQTNEVKEAKEIKTAQKFDFFAIIENSVKNVFQEVLHSDTLEFKVVQKPSEIVRKNTMLVYTTTLKIIQNDKKIDWTLVIPIVSLSKIFNIMIGDKDGILLNSMNSGLEGIANEIVVGIQNRIKTNSNEQYVLEIQKKQMVKDISNVSSLKVYELGLKYEEIQIPLYIILKGSKGKND